MSLKKRISECIKDLCFRLYEFDEEDTDAALAMEEAVDEILVMIEENVKKQKERVRIKNALSNGYVPTQTKHL